jgi:hypothetical protein
VRVYAYPDEPDHREQTIVRGELDSVEAETLRDAARRILDQGETIGSIIRDWTQRGIKPICVGDRRVPEVRARPAPPEL